MVSDTENLRKQRETLETLQAKKAQLVEVHRAREEELERLHQAKNVGLQRWKEKAVALQLKIYELK